MVTATTEGGARRGRDRARAIGGTVTVLEGACVRELCLRGACVRAFARVCAPARACVDFREAEEVHTALHAGVAKASRSKFSLDLWLFGWRLLCIRPLAFCCWRGSASCAHHRMWLPLCLAVPPPSVLRPSVRSSSLFLPPPSSSSSPLPSLPPATRRRTTNCPTTRTTATAALALDPCRRLCLGTVTAACWATAMRRL